MLRPHGLVQLLQHRIQLGSEHLVHLPGPAIIGKALIHKITIDDDHKTTETASD